MRYDQQRLVYENTKYLYYASNNGSVIRIDKKTRLSYKLTPYLHHGKACVKIDSKCYCLAPLIAKTFMREYYKGCCVGYKDGNERNCSIDNLFLYSYKTHGQKTGGLNGKCRAVIVLEKDKKAKKYRSVRAAARALYCSYQCLLDYLNGSSKNSVLDVKGRKIYYANDQRKEE